MSRVVVIGGGLAGISAAIALREVGAEVTLLEARPRLGGATCSFSRDGLVVDNGQHVFLRCCTAYRGLLGRLGMTSSVMLQDRFDVTVLRPGPQARQARLRRNSLPGPLHMGAALAAYPLLSLPERLMVGRAALAMKRLDPASPAVDQLKLGDWLAARGQSERARRALWDLFTVSSLNVAGDDANLALAATVVKTALLGKRDAADIGVPAVPLGDLHGQAAMDLLRRQGADVRLNAKVAAVEYEYEYRGPDFSFFEKEIDRADPVAGREPSGRGGGFSTAPSDPVAGGEPSGRGSGFSTVPSDPVAGSEPSGTGGGFSTVPSETSAAAPAGRGGRFIVRLGRHADPALPDGNGALTALNGAAGRNPGQKGTANGAAHGALTSGVIEADGVIIAVPPEQAARLIPPAASAAAKAAGSWRDLGSSPILNVHVVYDRKVMSPPFVAAVDSPVQWVFDRTAQSGLARDHAGVAGQYIAVSVSAADEMVDLPAAKLREIFVPALGELFPAAAVARVTDFFVTRERRATFRQEPGCERLRPPAATGLPGLALAGAWTDTGWPDTMEGAVRSGLNAARELRRSLGATARMTAVSHPAGVFGADA
ncbi:MAG TPA: FAD-dependent oxidoreductase [Streptosporangiaceae bacterium]|jgi:uncharacterized protein with NAD-binding domain and iron-sulfur cluster